MKFDILTLFPAMFEGPLTESILKRASDKGLIEIGLHNIRDWAFDKHATADDSPYGGGSGMVMKVEPLAGAIEAVKEKRPGSKVILTTPGGRPFTHQVAQELSREEGLIIICGRYEGVDERVRTLFVDDEISLGDFVLTGGEIAAMVIVDAVSRLVPGVLGHEESAQYDSFADGLLEYPQYTRPPEFRGEKVPDILLSGNHAEIAKWRRKEQIRRTLASRPELLDGIEWSKQDKKLLKELGLDPHVKAKPANLSADKSTETSVKVEALAKAEGGTA
ncbi:tRNA (guanosine(37)-N1)-methyltransferase TrmD [Geomonas paludis]|uniref:tRNA (guanine-N(1)-)-methyltransferase n=1 Tax=Geomonas paludis TaxID=2740185 RepID=A0A6V8N2T8_9BACT|nr:tRNA (guanosine(37)-N1)-methyltransferase TrmD [Geomonas paludis]UPU36792.1 tRNA (guanosine(37)-N1)-methyltransferase TrmD [Geomonas paludis]GFO66274.1 tRNA (guanine-N(1)-)-methyltransferase [Geomonas paludis]